tara:strand:- start:2824 stop:3534 length:711 start_codon:yes stop_codon:yes gene_type:complete
MTALIGDNRPPETPFDICSARIHDLYDETKLWLDGDPVNSESVAEGLSKLLDMIRKADGDRATAFKEEKAPLIAAAKACDDKWRELATLAERATKACKEALKPWLVKGAREKEEADRLAREEADRKLAAATKAIRESSVENLAEREAAEEKLREAKSCVKKAKAQARKPAGVAGGRRRTSLRTFYDVILHDPETALEHFWPSVELEATLISLAKAQLNLGNRHLPGFEIKERKETV